MKYLFLSLKTLNRFSKKKKSRESPINTVTDPGLADKFKDGTVGLADYASTLTDGVLHYPHSADLDEVGNMMLRGHSSTLKRPRYSLPERTVGNIYKTLGLVEDQDLIYIVQHDADMKQHVYTYRVEKIEVVDYDDVEALSQEVQGKRLTLGTCLPVGGTSERLMVRAKQVVSVEYDFDALKKQLPVSYQYKIDSFVQSMKEKNTSNDGSGVLEIAHQLRIMQDVLDGRMSMSEEHRARMELLLEYFVSQIAISYDW